MTAPDVRTKYAKIARQAALLSAITGSGLSSFAPKFELNIPQSAHDKQVRQALLQHMMALPADKRMGFRLSVPQQYREYLSSKELEYTVSGPKPTKHTYSNRYPSKRKMTATPRKVEAKEVFPTPTAKPIISDTDWNAFPPYPNTKPMSYRALSSRGVMTYYPAPSEMYTPAPQTPAEKVGATDTFKALAEKGKTAAFTRRVTAADVERVQGIEGTRQILDAEERALRKREKHAKRKMDSKSLASFNNSPRQGKGVRYHSRYGDDMRRVKAEAGI